MPAFFHFAFDLFGASFYLLTGVPVGSASVRCPGFIGAATLVAAAMLLLTIGVAVREGRRSASSPEPSPFVHWLTAAIAGLVLLAVVWETLPVLLVPVCS